MSESQDHKSFALLAKDASTCPHIKKTKKRTIIDWFHPGYSHPTFRKWQREATLLKSNLLYPIFVCDEPNEKQEIKSLPEQFRWGVNRLKKLLDPLVKKGVFSFFPFFFFFLRRSPFLHSIL